MCNAVVVVWQIIFSGLFAPFAPLSYFFFLLVSSVANMRTGRSKSQEINNFEVNVS